MLDDINAHIARQGGEPYHDPPLRKGQKPKFEIWFGPYGALWDLKKFAAKVERKSLRKILRGETDTQFAHLILHGDNEGYYLPVEFPHPFTLPNALDVGSTPALKRELERLNQHIGVDTARLDERFYVHEEREAQWLTAIVQSTPTGIATLQAPHAVQQVERDDRVERQVLWIRLYKAVLKSLHYHLPIIFA
ncbi:MAG: hypothetical protein NZT92_12585, partial [Abditibacteriales bacterium]|nr:hypothetical protein [Abditibacteriales bacterium]MDW8366592.1 hypothetical protein [Abditibacteriales bacterium]